MMIGAMNVTQATRVKNEIEFGAIHVQGIVRVGRGADASEKSDL